MADRGAELELPQCLADDGLKSRMPGTGEIGLHSVQYAGIMFKGRCLERLDNALCQLTRYSPSAGVPKGSHWRRIGALRLPNSLESNSTNPLYGSFF